MHQTTNRKPAQQQPVVIKQKYSLSDYIFVFFAASFSFFVIADWLGYLSQPAPAQTNYTFSVTEIASPIYTNLVASSTPTAPATQPPAAQPQTIVVTATPEPTETPLPTAVPTASATSDARRGRCSTQGACSEDSSSHRPITAVLTNICTVSGLCSQEPQRAQNPNEGPNR